MKPFQPDLVYAEPGALEYPLGRELVERFRQSGVPVRMTTSHNRVSGLPGKTDLEKYRIAKRTLVIGVRKTLRFDDSKPSAEYAIPLATGCMGHCHYCYLQTTLGSRPYIRVYVNLDEIFQAAKKYIDERAPRITRFEASCTSDPVGLEHLTGSLKKAVEFMAGQEFGRLRFVTKYAHIDPLLAADHRGHTRFRFSVNARSVTRRFEPGTSPLDDRIRAAARAAAAGYPLGFIVAPILLFSGWENEYEELFRTMSGMIPRNVSDLTFELITHRFTQAAKRVIEARYPSSELSMEESGRKKKWGRHGHIKYVYPDEQMQMLRNAMEGWIGRYFPHASIQYFT